MIRIQIVLLAIVMIYLVSSCKTGDNEPTTPAINNVSSVSISTDKAAYQPGQTVTFTIDKAVPSTTKVRYRHFNEILSENAISGTSWSWTPPSTDFTGYLADVYNTVGGKEVVYGSIAVDVSSDWVRFPRYGFLSAYPQMTSIAINYYINELNRYHINGLQFYDWQYKHHMPLSGTPSNPSTVWTDIANRNTYFTTVKGYIDAAHNCNMKAMFYNLAYGALSDAASDGVQDQWRLYKDASHSTMAKFDLSSSMFKSSIWLMDPSNSNWQQYLAARNQDVYTALGFDGFHIDQLGDWGTVYNYSGQTVNLPSAYSSFINAMKTAKSDKRLVMNAVNQFGQQNIATTPVDFLYTEVWSPNDGYKDLATIINNNDSYCNSTKKTVLAAYMDYDLANSNGSFNTAGVLLTDAVIFAFGGAHLELGEHMLGKEYFPNSNLQMKGDLRNSLFCYYDFMVAYQNLLRDGGSFNTPAISFSNNKLQINQWPPQTGNVAVVGKDLTNRQIIHLINFTNATSLAWRDNSGNQAVPAIVEGAALSFTSAKTVRKIWTASPDINYGIPTQLSFTQTGSTVSFTLPSLQYWDMIVVEY